MFLRIFAFILFVRELTPNARCLLEIYALHPDLTLLTGPGIMSLASGTVHTVQSPVR